LLAEVIQAYRLTVQAVKDGARFARLLVAQQVSYLLRELEHGIVWERGVEYDEELILRRLGQLPCTFLVSADQMRALLHSLKEEAIATFDYAHAGTPRQYDWRPENNTPD